MPDDTRSEIPSRRQTGPGPVLVGALVGAAVGTMLLMTVTLLAGAADWYLLGMGGAVDGALLGAVIGAAVREHSQDRARPHRPVRVVCLWAGIGLCIALALATILDQSAPVCAILGIAVGTVTGAIISRARIKSELS